VFKGDSKLHIWFQKSVKTFSLEFKGREEIVLKATCSEYKARVFYHEIMHFLGAIDAVLY